MKLNKQTSKAHGNDEVLGSSKILPFIEIGAKMVECATVSKLGKYNICSSWYLLKQFHTLRKSRHLEKCGCVWDTLKFLAKYKTFFTHTFIYFGN